MLLLLVCRSDRNPQKVCREAGRSSDEDRKDLDLLDLLGWILSPVIRLPNSAAAKPALRKQGQDYRLGRRPLWCREPLKDEVRVAWSTTRRRKANESSAGRRKSSKRSCRERRETWTPKIVRDAVQQGRQGEAKSQVAVAQGGSGTSENARQRPS